MKNITIHNGLKILGAYSFNRYTNLKNIPKIVFNN